MYRCVEQLLFLDGGEGSFVLDQPKTDTASTYPRRDVLRDDFSGIPLSRTLLFINQLPCPMITAFHSSRRVSA